MNVETIRVSDDCSDWMRHAEPPFRDLWDNEADAVWNDPIRTARPAEAVAAFGPRRRVH